MFSDLLRVARALGARLSFDAQSMAMTADRPARTAMPETNIVDAVDPTCSIGELVAGSLGVSAGTIAVLVPTTVRLSVPFPPAGNRAGVVTGRVLGVMVVELGDAIGVLSLAGVET